MALFHQYITAFVGCFCLLLGALGWMLFRVCLFDSFVFSQTCVDFLVVTKYLLMFFFVMRNNCSVTCMFLRRERWCQEFPICFIHIACYFFIICFFEVPQSSLMRFSFGIFEFDLCQYGFVVGYCYDSRCCKFWFVNEHEIKNVFFSRADFFICEGLAVPKFLTAINPDIISRRLRKPSCGMSD